MMRIDALLARYGYCSRREAASWIRAGRCSANGETAVSPAAKVDPREVLIDGQPVEFPDGLYVALNKPTGYICSHAEPGRLVLELLPERWSRRKPAVAMAGRLDKETSGLLLLSDDGNFIHRMTSPKSHVPKTYAFTTTAPVPEEAAALFASGELLLEGESKPCLPARLALDGPCSGTLVLHEGRYHQVRRMLASVGSPVRTLRRTRIGTLALEDLNLEEGAWTPVNPSLIAPAR